MNRVEQCFEKLKAQNQKAFIPFITAGDPHLDVTVELVKAMDVSGADIIELGVPYSDPMADGPIIQAACQRALKAGVTLRRILYAVQEIRRSSQVPLVLMSYYNPILQYGLKNFVLDAVSSGVDGVIVPDLPVEECLPLYKSALEKGLCLIPLVAPTTTQERLSKIAELAMGFIYCVSVTGITGLRQEFNSEISKLTNRVRCASSLPIAIGFGVSSPAQAVTVAQYCDAVIVGSAIVNIIGRDPGNAVHKVARAVAEYKAACSSRGFF
ncbi:tryptophan synthase subunit alpha [Desulfofalx alkaliphila]|uniref:tryptophan synthase subunit alpha n=1 Tax=Desulfofalx alkaliphila TaxID=105483 RepID=UPI0004E1F8AE|nr:tryptophan synthase subunit alpha [Desulfofalx alkaliphila]